MVDSNSFFLPNNQVTAQIVKNMDWSNHPLGSPSLWPLSLQYTLNILFHTKHPTTLYWGEEKFFFYNDAFIPILGSVKHSKAMGSPGSEVWEEVWDKFSLELNEVFKTGAALWNVDNYLPINRPGQSSEAYFSYSITPVMSEHGKPCGAMIICVETTEKVFRSGKAFTVKEYKSTNDATVPGVIVIGDDVTNQVNNGLTSDELTKKMHAIIENMNEGLILCDQNGKMLLWNSVACKMYGFNSVDDVYEYYSSFPIMFQLYSIDGDLLEINDWPLSRILRGERFVAQEFIVEKRDTTTERWIGSYSGSPIFNDQGRQVFSVMTIRDVTSKMDTERELKSAINSRDEFLSIVSHELKTPLTSLKLQNQTAIRKIKKGSSSDLSDDKLAILFDKNENQINRVIRLVDDMLDLTRIQSGKFSYNFVKCDLRDVILDVVDRFKDQFENAGSELINKGQNSVIGFFDRDRIEQVIVNLLTNALKYGKGNAVVIMLETLNNVARLEVQDHGIGIKLEDFEVIFKKYERVISANEVSGLGIGLFICREIVEAHGGTIWLESVVGEGSNFIAELPLDANNLK